MTKSIFCGAVLACFLLLICDSSFAQGDDLLKQLGESKPEKIIVRSAFKSPRVINSHSMEFLHPGTMDFRILHRFGQVNQGYQNFFGLDQASMRMGLDFGLSDNLMAGIGRSTFKKEVDGFVKYAPLRQTTGGEHNFPFTLALVAGITIDGLPWADTSRKNYYSSRLAYYFEAIIGRKFSERLTLQVAPIVVHKNLVQLQTDRNDIYAVGLGGRYKFSKRMALTFDYVPVLSPLPDENYNPVSIGIDIETGGHVFQLHFTNTTGMNERAFITETTGRWDRGDIRFGFNLSRIFQLVKGHGQKAD